MANYCETIYAVEGETGILSKIRDVINNVVKHHNDKNLTTFNLCDILIGLGLYTEKSLKEATKDYTDETPEGIGITGYWRDAKLVEYDDQVVLMFTEEYKWNCSCDMEFISKMEPYSNGITGVYRYSEEGGNGIYETTDESGKYFTKETVEKLGFEPEDIDIATGISAGECRRLAERIVAENFNF